MKLLSGLLSLTQLACLLKNLHPLLLEHHLPHPAQFIDRFQKRSLHIPSVDSNRIKKANSINPPNAAQQPQGGLGFGFARLNGFEVQQDVDRRPVDLGKDIAMIVFNDGLLLAMSIEVSNDSLAVAGVAAAASV